MPIWAWAEWNIDCYNQIKKSHFIVECDFLWYYNKYKY